MKEAMFWEPAADGKVQCRLCHQACVIPVGKRGFCGVRENREGRLVSLVYARPVAQAVDPIEKKPLYHFLPGSRAFSIGTRGCNFRCLHCQNCTISQVTADEDIAVPPPVLPEQIVSKARAAGCAGIAYTYTEPTVFYEYAHETAGLARQERLKNIFVTNGYTTPEALREIAPVLDAANIDLKFFRDDLYRRVCAAKLQPVLDGIRLYHELGIWIEITTLVIPGYNSDAGQLREIARFIAAIDPGIPWHVSGFHPAYKLTTAEPTPRSTLEKAERIGREAGLKHVYPGNIGALPDTRCADCGAVAVERSGFGVLSNRVDRGRCRECGAKVAGVWE